MQPEIEVQFFPRALFAEDLASLLQAGFKPTLPRTLMRRQMFTLPNVANSLQRARVRDEGTRVTMTTKRVDHDGIDGTQEAEVIIESFDDGVAFLTALGLQPRGFQENYCTRWKNDAGTEVSYSEWPGMPGYFEIEGPTEEHVYSVLENVFGISRTDASVALAGNAAIMYNWAIGIPEQVIWELLSITFEAPPQWPG